MKQIWFYIIIVLTSLIASFNSISIFALEKRENDANSNVWYVETSNTPIRKIDAWGAVVKYTQVESAADEEVYVKTTQSPSDVKIEQKDDCLYIGRKKGNYINTRDVEVYVKTVSLSNIEVSSAAIFDFLSDYNYDDNLELKISSAAKVNANSINLYDSKMKCVSTSIGSVNIEELISQEVGLVANSAAKINIAHLESAVVGLNASSTAKIGINGLMRTLSASASSAASVLLSGNAEFSILSAESGASLNSDNFRSNNISYTENSEGNIFPKSNLNTIDSIYIFDRNTKVNKVPDESDMEILRP